MTTNTVFQLRRNAVSGTRPTTTTVAPGELAINTTDGILFSANSTTVFEIGANNTSIAVGNSTVRQIANSSGIIVNGTAVINTNSTSDALRITQIGTGNALVVEDAANPDSTPLVVDASGQMVRGHTTPIATVNYAGNAATPSIQNISTGTPGASYGAFLYNASSSQSPQFLFSRSLSGTIGTPGAVASGNMLGAIGFNGDDGTNFATAASITSLVDGTPTTNSMPGRLVFGTTAVGDNAPTERMRITSSGLVGIGTGSLANQRLRVQYNLTDITATSGSIFADGTHTLTATNAFQYNNMESQSALNQGTFNQTTSLASGGGVRGFRAFTTTTGTGGTVTAAVGYAADVRNTGTGTLTNGVGFVAQAVQNTGGGTLTNAIGFYAAPQTGGTNNFGFYSAVASGTGRWNFYADGTADNYFAGNLGLGNTTPDARLTVTGTANVSGNVVIGGTTTVSGNLTVAATSELIIANGAGIQANGSFGSAGQVLSSNGTGVYWFTTPSATSVRQTFTANSTVNTTFTVTGGYTVGFVDVYKNGVKLLNGTDVTVTSGSTVVLATPAVSGEVVDVVGALTGQLVGATTDGVQTLTNKRIDPRVSSTASAASVTPDISSFDMYIYTALATGLTINATTGGSPVNGSKLVFRFRDNGTARALTWTTVGSNSFRAVGVTLPTTTVINKVTYVGCIYNADESFWDVIAAVIQA